MTVDEFEAEVVAACLESPIVVGVSALGAGLTWLRLRAYISDRMFIDSFYNEATGKVAFALVDGSERIFGADNTGSWHWHPFDDPNSHVPAGEPIPFLEFLRQVEEHLWR